MDGGKLSASLSGLFNPMETATVNPTDMRLIELQSRSGCGGEQKSPCV